MFLCRIWSEAQISPYWTTGQWRRLEEVQQKGWNSIRKSWLQILSNMASNCPESVGSSGLPNKETISPGSNWSPQKPTLIGPSKKVDTEYLEIILFIKHSVSPSISTLSLEVLEFTLMLAFDMSWLTHTMAVWSANFQFQNFRCHSYSIWGLNGTNLLLFHCVMHLRNCLLIIVFIILIIIFHCKMWLICLLHPNCILDWSYWTNAAWNLFIDRLEFHPNTIAMGQDNDWQISDHSFGLLFPGFERLNDYPQLKQQVLEKIARKLEIMSRYPNRIPMPIDSRGFNWFKGNWFIIIQRITRKWLMTI